MTLPYRRSAQADRCRWPEPDTDGRCRYCGWPLTLVRTYEAEAGVVIGHYRHRRPRLPAGMGAEAQVENPQESSNPHEGGTTLTLSEVVPSDTSVAPDPLSTDRTRSGQLTYPHEPDSNRAFRQRGGASGRLLIPTLDEWVAWKAAVA